MDIFIPDTINGALLLGMPHGRLRAAAVVLGPSAASVLVIGLTQRLGPT